MRIQKLLVSQLTLENNFYEIYLRTSEEKNLIGFFNS